jgi:hypothetical protein
LLKLYQSQSLWGGVVSTYPNPKLQDHPLLGVHDCLFNIFAVTSYTVCKYTIQLYIYNCVKYLLLIISKISFVLIL